MSRCSHSLFLFPGVIQAAMIRTVGLSMASSRACHGGRSRFKNICMRTLQYQFPSRQRLHYSDTIAFDLHTARERHGHFMHLTDGHLHQTLSWKISMENSQHAGRLIGAGQKKASKEKKQTGPQQHTPGQHRMQRAHP